MPMSEFVLCARSANADGSFGAEVGSSSLYLIVPDGQQSNSSMQTDGDAWARNVQAAATRPDGTGDILVYIHGYNNSQTTVMARHRLLRDGVTRHGFAGTVVSFDWPCGDSSLAYLADRAKARQTALT